MNDPACPPLARRIVLGRRHPGRPGRRLRALRPDRSRRAKPPPDAVHACGHDVAQADASQGREGRGRGAAKVPRPRKPRRLPRKPRRWPRTRRPTPTRRRTSRSTATGSASRTAIPAAEAQARRSSGLGGTDREYDSFDQFVHEDRGLAVMVVGIVFIVFLTPVLITGLVIWYKLRKNRMLNDTMIQLAEKGVVPTAEMLQALQLGPDVGRRQRDGRARRRWWNRSRRCAATRHGRTCARA